MTPIFEKDSKLKCFYYRPISLLFNIDKIFEKNTAYNHLYKLIEDNNLIDDLRFGFPQKHSTSHASINLTEEFDNGSHICGIFVEFQKAFDTVGHAILIQKLNYYGVRGKANNCRNQFVSIEGFDFKEIDFKFYLRAFVFYYIN